MVWETSSASGGMNGAALTAHNRSCLSAPGGSSFLHFKAARRGLQALAHVQPVKQPSEVSVCQHRAFHAPVSSEQKGISLDNRILLPCDKRRESRKLMGLQVRWSVLEIIIWLSQGKGNQKPSPRSPPPLSSLCLIWFGKLSVGLSSATCRTVRAVYLRLMGWGSSKGRGRGACERQ